MNTKRQKGFTLIELIIVIVILTVLWAMSIPSCYSPARRRRYQIQKECFSNQRVLNGATEMYNMDSKEIITKVLPGADYEDFENELIRGNYLKEPLIPPSDECSYGYIEEKDDVGVFCKVHGKYTSSSVIKLPKYDKSKEKPLSRDYYSFRKSIKTSKTIREAREGIINIIISKPFLIFIGITIFILSIIPYKKKNKSNIQINR